MRKLAWRKQWLISAAKLMLYIALLDIVYFVLMIPFLMTDEALPTISIVIAFIFQYILMFPIWLGIKVLDGDSMGSLVLFASANVLIQVAIIMAVRYGWKRWKLK